MYRDNLAVFEDLVGIEEADELLKWTEKCREGSIDLSKCTHMHTAIVQLLMVSGNPIRAWPAQHPFAQWLKSALQNFSRKEGVRV